MTLFTNASELLPGLSQGSFRGVKFEIVDAEHEVGRRIVTHFFPGVDPQAREDQGRLDGPVKVMGLIVGEDYIARAKALEAALKQAGPGTLVHPWLGEMRVVVPFGARIRFSTGELRVARFDVLFEPETERLASSRSSASRLASSTGSLRAAAGGLLSSALVARLSPVNALDAAFTIGNTLLGSAISGAERLKDGAALADTLSTLLRTVSSNPTLDAVAGAVPELSRLMGLAARPRPRPAIAVGGNNPPAPPATPDPAATARLALQIAGEAAAISPLIVSERAAQAAYYSALTSASIEAAVLIGFEAREEAYGWREDLDGALAKSIQLSGGLTETLPGPAATLTRALRETRSALFTDLNEVIGRLPRTVVVRGGLPALMIAYDLSGDAPDSVAEFAADITRRNRLPNPAVTPLTGIEVLQ